MTHGSDTEARDRIAWEVLERGGSGLDAKYAGVLAGYTEGCWRQDRKVAEILGCHPKSLPRTRKRLRLQGFITSRRIMPGGELPRMRGDKNPPNRSAKGTTHTRIVWTAFNLRSRYPSARSTRRAAAAPSSSQPTERTVVHRPATPSEERPAASALASVLSNLAAGRSQGPPE